MESEDTYLLFLRIDPGADYGRIKLGQLELTWFNPDLYDDGSFYLGWGRYWELRMAYYRSYDPFTGKVDNDYNFPDWEIICYQPELGRWKRSVNITGRVLDSINRVKRLFGK